MPSTTSDDHQIQDGRLDQFPALASLRLRAADLKELASQGFVCAERRGSRTYYKLRFRSGGKQVVRYIGGADRAAIVNGELAILQQEAKLLRELKAKTKVAHKMLREVKLAMEPVLEAEGFVFHGLAIRRPRRRRNEAGSRSNS